MRKLGQRSPQGNIKTGCYATPHKPENAANCRRDTYGMPFVSLILSIHTAAASCREHERKYGLTSFISVTETVVSVEHQIAANQRVPDASHEIIISATEIIICAAETILSVLQIIIS